MITLIHGEDIAASRNYYFELKQQAQEPLTVDGATISPTDLQQALSGNDLFGTKKDIFIENLVSKRKSPKEVETLTAILITSDANSTLWESKELTKKQIENFGKATVRLFKIPSTIFALLDALKPGNGKQLIELFHQTLKDKDAEFVLVMLQRQVRILLALCHPELVSGSQQISELSRLAPWQKGKLEKQAKLFTPEKLIDLHEQLFDLEKNMKTGGLSQSLENEIDFLLLAF